MSAYHFRIAVKIWIGTALSQFFSSFSIYRYLFPRRFDLPKSAKIQFYIQSFALIDIEYLIH